MSQTTPITGLRTAMQDPAVDPGPMERPSPPPEPEPGEDS